MFGSNLHMGGPVRLPIYILMCNSVQHPAARRRTLRHAALHSVLGPDADLVNIRLVEYHAHRPAVVSDW